MNCAASLRALSSVLGLVHALLCNYIMQFLPFIIACGTIFISQLHKTIQIRENQTLFSLTRYQTVLHHTKVQQEEN